MSHYLVAPKDLNLALDQGFLTGGKFTLTWKLSYFPIRCSQSPEFSLYMFSENMHFLELSFF